LGSFEGTCKLSVDYWIMTQQFDVHASLHSSRLGHLAVDYPHDPCLCVEHLLPPRRPYVKLHCSEQVQSSLVVAVEPQQPAAGESLQNLYGHADRVANVNVHSRELGRGSACWRLIRRSSAAPQGRMAPRLQRFFVAP